MCGHTGELSGQGGACRQHFRCMLIGPLLDHFRDPRPMSRTSAATIAKSLKQRIDAGEWSEGRRMPPERELAEGFGVARNTVRRAIHLLGQTTPLTREVGRGTFLEG